ncbi:MAG: hypothetical protein ACHQE5_00890 [Actinomycetes bacterium]
MTSEDLYGSNESDAVGLITVGRHLLYDQPFVDAVLPTDLADRAASAWERQTRLEGRVALAETGEERAVRYQAWALAQIGLAVLQTGEKRGDLVRVRLPTAAFSRAVCAIVDDPTEDDDEEMIF